MPYKRSSYDGFSAYKMFIGTKNNVYFHTPKIQDNQKKSTAVPPLPVTYIGAN